MIKYKNLDAELVKMGVTKKEFAKEIGLSTQSLWTKQTGKSDWTLPLMKKCKDIINQKTHQELTLEYLFKSNDN